MRASGVLLPIASLPGPYGIGCFSKEAYKFIDQLRTAGQRYWQILPLGPTGYGDSPYQSFSTFAGNPYFIDLTALIELGLISEEECTTYDFGEDLRSIDYEKLYLSRFLILRKAYERSDIKKKAEFHEFCEQNKEWLDDYALYMVVKNHFQGKSWCEWEEDIRLRTSDAINLYSKLYENDILFYKFQQYLFGMQWKKLKKYANNKGIKIIGDIPIYVAFDSADTWANPELFQFDMSCMPTTVAGCPPDGFSATGQLWGNPLYRWEYHAATGYEWWLKRIQYSYSLYDVIRIDHFRGFDEYYSIPFGHETAEHGQWIQGPGYDIFQKLNQKLGLMDIIAEDLGYLTDSVKELVKATGYPGMKVLQFAFDSREESDYLPHNYKHNSVVYTGTHDNNTLLGWVKTISKEDRALAVDYLGAKSLDDIALARGVIRLAQSSVADTCIIPIQDYLELGEAARVNEPSTVGKNWKWRMLENEIKPELLEQMKHMTKLYGR
ncbi:4-alpha-glucanotransferase [Lachnospiraceae bacterium LCP25S3_G4]